MKKLAVLVETVRRFPAASLLALFNAVFVAWAFGTPLDSFAFSPTSDNVPMTGLYASGLTIVLSAVATLLAERWIGRRSLRLLVQAALLAVFAVLFAVFLNGRVFEEHFLCSYYGTLLAFAALVPVALRWTQRERDLFPTLFCSAAVACAASFCVAAGLSLVLLTVETLFPVDVSWRVYSTIWGAAFAAVGTEFLLAYATRREAFAFPKAFRVLLVYVVFPIFLLLLGVLWAYLGKCVVLRALPNGEINVLVTMAGVGWMALHLLLGGVDGGAPVRLFRRFGALLILPLSGLQACALAIRLADYGLTPARYASGLFVGFTVLWAFAILFWHARSELVGFLLLAATALFAALSPWNLVDVGVRAQAARLAAFAERREAGEAFSAKDRERIMGAWDFVQRYEQENGHYRRVPFRSCATSSKKEFRDEWGFAYLDEWERRDRKMPREGLYFDVSPSEKMDVRPFASLSKVRLSSRSGRLLLTGEKKGEAIDATEAYRAALRAHGDVEPDETLESLVVRLDESRSVLFVSGYVLTEEEQGETKIVTAYGTGLLLEVEK